MLKNILPPRWKLPQTRLRFLIIVLLVLGLFFRFVNLERKVYGHDETFTSLRVSGYTEAEVVQHFSDTHVISIDDLQKYQRPNLEKGLTDTIRGLAVEEPQLTPLYFVMAKFWAQWFGSSIAVMRSLPAFISLLALPCMYWLCLELFESPLTGWVAVGLITVSPYHVLYAQEARPYSLWTVTILLSSAALLRAMRLKTKVSWGIYAVTLAAGLYSFLFSVLIAIGHGIYVAVIEGFRLSKTLTAYLVASALGIIAFLPWLLVVIINRSQAQSLTAWQSSIKVPLLQLFRSWAREPGRVFLDLNLSSQDPLIYRITAAICTLILLFLVGYSFYFLCRKTPKRIWLFIFSLIGSTALALILQDLIRGGRLSTISRYLPPCYLGFQLAVTYLLATKLTCISSWQQKLWQLVLIGLVSGGVLSCTISSQAQVWWNKGDPDTLQDILAAVRIINQANRPLLISDTRTDTIMVVSYLLNPKVQLLIKPQCFTCRENSELEVNSSLIEISNDFSDVFLFPYPSEKLLYALEKKQTYKIKSISQLRESVLWKLEKE